jgi:hypothetical protein
VGVSHAFTIPQLLQFPKSGIEFEFVVLDFIVPFIERLSHKMNTKTGKIPINPQLSIS